MNKIYLINDQKVPKDMFYYRVSSVKEVLNTIEDYDKMLNNLESGIKVILKTPTDELSFEIKENRLVS